MENQENILHDQMNVPPTRVRNLKTSEPTAPVLNESWESSWLMAHASDPISAPDKAPFEVRSAVMADGGGTNAPERHTWYDGLLAAGAAVAARWLNEHPAARAHVMRAYRYLSDRDVCLALLMVLGGALFFGRLRGLAYYGLYVGYPLVLTFQALESTMAASRASYGGAAAAATATRVPEAVLRNHLCFWSLSAVIHALLNILAGPHSETTPSRSVAALFAAFIGYAAHLLLNVMLWWRPHDAALGRGAKFSGAAWIWTYAVRQHIAPRLQRSWCSMCRQLQAHYKPH
ncbi:hypothetical protein CDCA_CDCA17G4326 [Cyanidium caldarium]|uniref:Uncharacterized protein n=1 Tax=Cyanidium caldarium TaxID=2771 RepID=A0AAV9J1Z2_CYACA|nr:hypothetical protein CDCA_CDCA17G4326 [Cyanidium caldarium]